MCSCGVWFTPDSFQYELSSRPCVRFGRRTSTAASPKHAGRRPLSVCLGRLSRPCVGAGPCGSSENVPQTWTGVSTVVLRPPEDFPPGFPAHGLSLIPGLVAFSSGLVSFTGSSCSWRDQVSFLRNPSFPSLLSFGPLWWSYRWAAWGTAVKTPPA